MNIVGVGRRVRIYTGEFSRWEHKPLYLAMLELLRAEGAAGATVTRGAAGFGANSRIHTATILRLSEDMPMIIDWVDTPARVERLLPRICEMALEGLITVEEVQIAQYSHRPVRADVPEHLRVVEVMREMLARRRKIVPVVDGQGRVIGIVDRFDLLQAIAGLTQRGP